MAADTTPRSSRPDMRNRLSHEYKVFLDHLRNARKAALLTQANVAKLLGQTQSLVSKIERGERRVDIVELHALCAALGISTTSFVRRFERALRNDPKEKHATTLPAVQRERLP